MIGHQNFYPYQFPQYLQQPSQQSNQQIQNGGFVVVHTEDEAMRYPVAPGNSVTFKIENQPVVIEKTMGFSQLDSPRIERFRLVKENVEEQKTPVETVKYALADDLEKLKTEIAGIKERLNRKPAKKEAESE
jgi:hypothetical protein